MLEHQVAAHQEVTVTDPAVDRFFMTVEEAVGLVLEAGAMAEDGETFVLDMGEPVRITSLVEAYAAQVGADDVASATPACVRERRCPRRSSGTTRSAPPPPTRASPRPGWSLPDDLDSALQKLLDAAEDDDDEDVRLRDVRPDRPLHAAGSGRRDDPASFATLYPDGF